MPKRSAGLLMYRFQNGALEVFLVHPGGPFWAKKDLGAWSIPKGEYNPDEDALAAAKREFAEETGCVFQGDILPLPSLKQPSGKIIAAWAFEGDCDPKTLRSNTFSLEWPPRSGRQQEFPEVDRAGWFGLDEAKEKIIKGQVGFLEELEQIIKQKT
ncbi:MAG: NUDIX domain-containing protein [Deltaproteobacteria bacterium]|nr:NUDIX domain-containing protein [Deltaproteobacteria bacterium]